MLHVALFASVSVLHLTGATAKKSKTKSDLALLVDTQNRWKAFWNKAAVDVVVNNCKGECGWKDLAAEESHLRTETVELVMKQPQYEASLAEFLALSHRGSSPKEHGMTCHASAASTRDDYCICAQDTTPVDWEKHCSKSKDNAYCHSFLHNMCGIEFQNKEEQEDVDDFEDLEDVEERLHRSGSEPQKEKPSKTEEHLLRLQAALTNLDNEHKELYEVHAENSRKGNGKSVRPLLSSLDRRIKRQKDKILRDMEELVNRREKELAKEVEETERGQEEYHKRLKALLAEDHEM